MDPNFEIEYYEDAATPLGLGTCVVATDTTNILKNPTTGEQLKKIGVKTSLIDRETAFVGVLQRGYIAQQVAAFAIKVTAKVISDSSGKPIELPSTVTAVNLSRVYGYCIGLANTNDQTKRVDVGANLLGIIKVGDA